MYINRFTSLLTGFFAALWASGSAVAATPPSYHLDAAHSQLDFTAVGKPGFLRINGKEASVSGKATTSTGGVLTGVFETSLDEFKTGIDLRDEHMKKKYLETEKFPKAVLTWTVPSESVGAGKEVEFTGTLAVHGVERPVKGTAKVESSAGGLLAKIEATFPLKLSDFKIDIPSYLGVTVAEDVVVRAHLTAIADKGTN